MIDGENWWKWQKGKAKKKFNYYTTVQNCLSNAMIYL